MKLLISAFCFLLFQYSFSQRVIDISKQDGAVNESLFFTSAGEPFVTAKFVNLVEGTPYFKDQWMKASLVNKGNQRYNNVDVKLDLLDNALHYLDKDGKELIATTFVKQIELNDSQGNQYEVLTDKKDLLEEYLKTKDNAKLPTEQRFINLIQYYNSLPE